MTLLVIGDGDFSFSKSLLKYVNCDKNYTIISSCYESYNEVIEKYSQAEYNINFIKNNGGFVQTSVDGTQLHKNKFEVNFDVIVFNFPHIGGKSNIKKNRILLSDFFKSVKESGILNEHGSVCVSLCQGQAGTNIDVNDRDFGNSWQLEEMAAQSNFYLFDVRQFDLKPFGDYIPTGFRSQEKRFRLNGARAYVFVSGTCVENTDLTGEINIDGRRYVSPAWVADIWESLSGRNTMNDCVVDFVKNSVTLCHVKEWSYVMNTGKNEGAVELLDGDSCDYLCWSPWQQVVEIISQKTVQSDNSPITVLTHGTSFYGYSQRSDISIEKYIVLIESPTSTTTSESYDQQCCLDAKTRDLLTMNEIDIVSTRTSTFSTLPCIVAHLSDNNNTHFIATVINVSHFIRDKLSIATNDSFVSLDSIRQHFTQLLDDIFPTYLHDNDNDTVTVPSFVTEHLDVVRILAQRKKIDICPFRDVSFWLPDSGAIELDDLMRRIDEICRCVLRRQMTDGRIVLMDDYVDGESGRRSICLRIAMRSALSALSRSRINQLQSAVRVHCERIFKVQLR